MAKRRWKLSDNNIKTNFNENLRVDKISSGVSYMVDFGTGLLNLWGLVSGSWFQDNNINRQSNSCSQDFISPRLREVLLRA
jgi:hypothetical protein